MKRRDNDAQESTKKREREGEKTMEDRKKERKCPIQNLTLALY